VIATKNTLELSQFAPERYVATTILLLRRAPTAKKRISVLKKTSALQQKQQLNRELFFDRVDKRLFVVEQ
jgi:hypothetical protein